MHPILYFAIFLTLVALFTLEVIAPASKNACDKRWLVLASSINALQLLVALIAGYLFHEWFTGYSLLKFEGRVAAPVGGLLTFLFASFVGYWWHRLSHASPLLWRVFHQLHHSPSRIESLTAFFAHPFDSVAASLISCLTAYLVFGLSVSSAAWAVLYVSLFNLYIHSDTKSPRWLGYIIQRPEMHRVHHRFGHHAQNYGLPVWDALFGTWANPTERVEQCGFSSEKSAMVCEMLRTKDVHA
jgi:sterol desaturase/sphingolipid hydroxylase (fatty acid hydroxylase superfamily)